MICSCHAACLFVYLPDFSLVLLLGAKFFVSDIFPSSGTCDLLGSYASVEMLSF